MPPKQFEYCYYMEARDKILIGAEELFNQYGLKSITMDDIAKHIGMSKKTIYQFFEDKESVIHHLMEYMLGENQKIFAGIHHTASNCIDEIFKCMAQMNVMFSHRNPVLFYDLQKYYPGIWHLFRTFKQDFILQMTAETLEKGKADGLIREDINVGILARLRIAEIDMGFNPMAFPPEQFNVTEVQMTMAEHFLYGACTLEGFKQLEKFKRKQLNKT